MLNKNHYSFCILICLMFLPQAQANIDGTFIPNKFKDQDLLIVLGAAPHNGDNPNCVLEVKNASNSNCQYAKQRKNCQGVDECVCTIPDKKISWKLMPAQNNPITSPTSRGSDQQTMFEIYFYNGDSPFVDDIKCKLKSQKNEITCKVNKNKNFTTDFVFDYGIKIPGCPDYDPRIVVSGL